jgi:hypothetical protein
VACGFFGAAFAVEGDEAFEQLLVARVVIPPICIEHGGVEISVE